MKVSTLPKTDLDRLGKLLGLLGSNHDGERAAAALKATAFLSSRSLSWHDVVATLKAPPAIQSVCGSKVRSSHRADAKRCLSSGMLWKAHEREFLAQMLWQRRNPSPRQRDWLDGLLDRLDRQEGGDDVDG